MFIERGSFASGRAVQGDPASPAATRAATTVAALIATFCSMLAPAQQADQSQSTPSAQSSGEASSQSQQLQEVTVTGSRIKRTTDFSTPTPTTVIDASTMESMGVVNVGEAMTIAPANISTFTPANTGNSNFFTGEYIADLRGLNPYFGSRTLLLVNGQRIVNSNQGDSFDLNLLPQILVSRIDTVTGGASAAYGSGAIAGVENVIIDDKLEGGKLDGDFFQTSHSDARDRHIGAAYGHGLFDGRIHFEIGGEYQASDALGCEYVRSWCAQNQGGYQTGYNAQTATYSYNFGSNLRTNFLNTNGVLFPPADFGGYQPGGTGPVTTTSDGTALASYATGSPQLAPSYTVQGGDGTPLYQYSNLQAPVNRGVGMALLNGAVTDSINFNASFLMAREVTTTYSGAFSTYYDYVTPQNAYACPGTANGSIIGATCTGSALSSSINDGSVYLDKNWSGQSESLTRFTTNVTRVTFGLDGKFGDSSWTWDANYEYGLTHHDQLVQGNLSITRMEMALDTVTVNGVAECRVTADGFAGAVAANPLGGYASANPALADGCVPIDPFGDQPLSQAQIDYAFGNLLEELRYTQTDANLDFSGNYFQGVGAGPFSAAFGYEWRQERGDNVDQPGEPAYLADDYEAQYGSSFGGVMTVNEEYLETNLPLLKDRPGAKLLELDLAARESAYANEALYGIDVCDQGAAGCPTNSVAPGETITHDFPTWKLSAIYDPVEWLRFRGSQSRDERAPNFRELYYNQQIQPGGIFGYCDPSYAYDKCTWNLLGNPDLKPETANTTTLGIVLTPSALIPGLQFSADWFHIKVTNAIEQANVSLVELGCKAGLSQFCDQMTFKSSGYTAAGVACSSGSNAAAAYAGGCYNVDTIDPTSYNGAFYEVRGVDFSLNYLVGLGSFGTLNTRLLTTWMGEQEFQAACVPAADYCPTYSLLGQTGNTNNFLPDYTPAARWRGSLMITWANGPWSVTPNMTFVGHGTMDFLGVTPSETTLYNEVITGTLPKSLQGYGFVAVPYNYVPSYFLFGLNGAYQVQPTGLFKSLQLFVQVNNLFNKTPPFAGWGNEYGGTNPIYFDTLGLACRVGFRSTF